MAGCKCQVNSTSSSEQASKGRRRSRDDDDDDSVALDLYNPSIITRRTRAVGTARRVHRRRPIAHFIPFVRTYGANYVPSIRVHYADVPHTRD